MLNVTLSIIHLRIFSEFSKNILNFPIAILKNLSFPILPWSWEMGIFNFPTVPTLSNISTQPAFLQALEKKVHQTRSISHDLNDIIWYDLTDTINQVWFIWQNQSCINRGLSDMTYLVRSNRYDSSGMIYLAESIMRMPYQHHLIVSSTNLTLGANPSHSSQSATNTIAIRISHKKM